MNRREFIGTAALAATLATAPDAGIAPCEPVVEMLDPLELTVFTVVQTTCADDFQMEWYEVRVDRTELHS